MCNNQRKQIIAQSTGAKFEQSKTLVPRRMHAVLTSDNDDNSLPLFNIAQFNRSIEDTSLVAVMITINKLAIKMVYETSAKVTKLSRAAYNAIG